MGVVYMNLSKNAKRLIGKMYSTRSMQRKNYLFDMIVDDCNKHKEKDRTYRLRVVYYAHKAEYEGNELRRLQPEKDLYHDCKNVLNHWMRIYDDSTWKRVWIIAAINQDHAIDIMEGAGEPTQGYDSPYPGQPFLRDMCFYPLNNTNRFFVTQTGGLDI